MIFHLAIPSHDLEKSVEFYVHILECSLARKYNDRITLNFFNHQLVCHLDPNEVNLHEEVKIYPRHFGMTFTNREEYNSFLKKLIEKNINFYKKPFIRFEGMREEHSTFFLIDPSNNLLEFKFYNDIKMSY